VGDVPNVHGTRRVVWKAEAALLCWFFLFRKNPRGKMYLQRYSRTAHFLHLFKAFLNPSLIPSLASEGRKEATATTLVDHALASIAAVKVFNAAPYEQCPLNKVLERLNRASKKLIAMWGATSAAAQSPTPDPKEREEGFVRRERPRHHTIVLPQRENVLYSCKNFLFLCAASHDKRENVLYSRKIVRFRVKISFFGPEIWWAD
jgi:hypothetical protein